MKIFLQIIALFLSIQGKADIKPQIRYLSEKEILMINENWPGYKYGTEKVSDEIPAAILAAIHYRENGLYREYYNTHLKKFRKNIGGPFMLDFGEGETRDIFSKRIREYEERICVIYNIFPCPQAKDDFNFAALTAAHHLIVKAPCDLNQYECLAQAAWGYNGKAKSHRGKEGWSWKYSPYTANDPKRGYRLPMNYKRRDGTINKELDKRPGVMVIYNEILELQKEGRIQK